MLGDSVLVVVVGDCYSDIIHVEFGCASETHSHLIFLSSFHNTLRPEKKEFVHKDPILQIGIGDSGNVLTVNRR